MTTFAIFFKKIKAIGQLIQRHFFTFCLLSMVIMALFDQIPIDWSAVFMYSCLALVIDWARRRFKGFNNGSYSGDDFYQGHRRHSEQYEKNNPCVLYSPAYNLSHLGQRY